MSRFILSKKPPNRPMNPPKTKNNAPLFIFQSSIFSLILLLTACTAPAPTPPLSPTLSPTFTLQPSTTATGIKPAPTIPPPDTLTPSPPPPLPLSPTPSPTPPLPSLPFRPPIAPPGRGTIDPTYRFGSTQNDAREPHHGVEFLNSQGTPVLAAADGTVIHAGDDYNGGPYTPPRWYAFYGLFVVVQHDLPDYPEPVYTLYAHLSEVTVALSQTVQTGDQLGLVGFTGAAEGAHLHFEVRYGGTTYTHSRNPELWQAPPGHGALAGRIIGPNGRPWLVASLVLTPLDPSQPIRYLAPYEDPALLGQPPYAEHFAIGSLPPGQYTLTFVALSLQEHLIEIHPGEVTEWELRLTDE